jgi:hypothetical protein
MEIPMRHAILGPAAAVLLLVGPAAPAAASPTEGTWTLNEGAGPRMQLMLHWGTSNWGRGIDLGELRGLTRQQIDASTSTPVVFRLEREAGVFEMEGAFREGRGAGHFRFVPNPGFGATLRGLGVREADQVTDNQLMQLAIAGTTAAGVREFAGLGLSPLTLRDLIQLSIHNVTPEYVRSLRALGIDGTGTVSGVVQMRIHRVTPEYVRSVEALGLRGLTSRQLLQMRIHGVRPEEVRELRALGYTDLSPQELVEMRIHRVTPEFIREIAAAGYPNLARSQLVRMRIHGVTPAFIREMREAGHTAATPETLVRLRIHGGDAGRTRARERRRP